MPSLMVKRNFRSAAAILAEEAGKDWSDMDEKEKEIYYSKAIQRAKDARNTSPVGQ